MEKLVAKNKEFMRAILTNDPKYFDRLKEGQHPEYFVLSCSDSRVCPSVITQMPLGNLFIHRNIANIVDEEDESFSASLYYALVHLKIKKIIIEGHTCCGGVKAAWDGNEELELQYWLKKVKHSLYPIEVENPMLDELTKVNVISQVKRLKTHPVYVKYGSDIPIIGCLFHVESGELEIVKL